MSDRPGNPWKHAVKRWLFAAFPQLMTRVVAVRSRRHNQRYYAASGLQEIGGKIRARYGQEVLSGPFRGLKLPGMVMPEHIAPYLLGCYEQELHPALEALLQHPFSNCVDIGAKFGYYAIGMALRQPRCAVLAFDTDTWAQRATSETAALNGVRLEMRSFCSRQWLKESLPANSFVLSDCEGFEAELFAAPLGASAGDSAFLVETHDHANPQASTIVKACFAGSHRVIEILPQARRAPDIDLGFLTEREKELALADLRPAGQSWILAIPRASKIDV